MKRFASVFLAATAVLLLTSVACIQAAPASKPAAKPAAKSAGKTATPIDSLDILTKAVARDSSKWDNLYRLGLMLMDRDRPLDAQHVLMKANLVRPDNVPTLVNLGAAYDALGQAAQAQAAYHSALVLSPEDTVANCRLASSLYSTADYGKAIDILRTLIARNPNAYCAYFTLGVAFADAGIYRDAIRMWEKVVALAPTSPEALSAKESIDVLQRVLQSNTQH